MTFTKFFPGCDRTVKGHQIDDAVLRANGSMSIHSPSFSPAALLIREFLSEGFPHAVERMFYKSFKSDSDGKITPRLVPTLEFFHSISFKFIENLFASWDPTCADCFWMLQNMD